MGDSCHEGLCEKVCGTSVMRVCVRRCVGQCHEGLCEKVCGTAVMTGLKL